MASINLKMGVDNAQFKTGLEQAKGKAKNFKKTVTAALGSAFAIMGVGMAVRKIISGIDTITEKYDRLAKLSKAHGNINTEFFQKAAFVAEQSGTNVEAVAKGMNKLLMSTRMAADGSKLYVDAFKDLNIEIVEFQKLDQEGKFKAIADAVKFSIDQDTAKAAVLQVMGMRATELIPLLQGGAEGFEKIGKNVNTLTRQGLQDIEDFRDAINEIKMSLLTLGAQSLPPILTETMIFFKAMSNTQKNAPMVESLWAKMGRFGDEIKKAREEWVKVEGMEPIKEGMKDRIIQRQFPDKAREQFFKQIDEADSHEQLHEIQKNLVGKFEFQDAGASQLQKFPSFGLGAEESNKIWNQMLQQLILMNENIEVEGAGSNRRVVPPPKPYTFSWDD